MRRELFTSIPKGFECEIRYYCSTCQEEVSEDDMHYKTHNCEESMHYVDPEDCKCEEKK